MFRALCDALGFTGLSKVVGATEPHAEAVEDARRFFAEDADNVIADFISPLVSMDAGNIRRFALRLIAAKQTGDHTGLPPIWRKAFRAGRMPSFDTYRKDIEAALKRS